MGIQYSAKLVYGVDVESVDILLLEEDGLVLESLGLDIYGNGYDSGNQVIGVTLFSVQQYDTEYFSPETFEVALITAKKEFEQELDMLNKYSSARLGLILVADAF